MFLRKWTIRVANLICQRENISETTSVLLSVMSSHSLHIDTGDIAGQWSLSSIALASPWCWIPLSLEWKPVSSPICSRISYLLGLFPFSVGALMEQGPGKKGRLPLLGMRMAWREAVAQLWSMRLPGWKVGFWGPQGSLYLWKYVRNRRSIIFTVE